MNIKVIQLIILEKICKLIGKDSMRYRINKYRLYGATIGENVRTFSAISSSGSYLLSIGNNVTIASGVRFITHDNSAIKIYDNATDFVGSIQIGNNVFVGANSILLPGISIADNCIIGGGSVVCKSILIPGTVVAGNPAKPIGNVESMKKKYVDKTFDFRHCDRKEEILLHPERWINR